MSMLNEKPQYVLVPRPQLMLIDRIVEKLKDNTSGVVETQNDWEAVVMLFDLFRSEHPAHFAHFVETMKQYRLNTSHNNAIIKDDSGDMVQHMLEVPEMFHQYMHYMFPNQKWEKKFIMKLTRELPILKVAEKL
jgi:hypothetical protein